MEAYSFEFMIIMIESNFDNLIIKLHSLFITPSDYIIDSNMKNNDMLRDPTNHNPKQSKNKLLKLLE